MSFDDIDKIIDFYSKSPDGQYDSEVVEILEHYKELTHVPEIDPPCYLEIRLYDEMQKEFEETGQLIDRDYYVGADDFRHIKEKWGCCNMSGLVLNGDYGRYVIKYDKS